MCNPHRGLAQACLDAVTSYCQEREQFGQPIGQFQMNQDLVAQITAEIEAARLVVYRAAWQKDQGNLGNNTEVAMGKLLSGELAQLEPVESASRLISLEGRQ